MKLEQINVFTGLHRKEDMYAFNLLYLEEPYYFCNTLSGAIRYINKYNNGVLYINNVMLGQMTELKTASVIKIILRKIKKKQSNLKLFFVCNTYIPLYSVYLYSKLYKINLKCFVIDDKNNIKDLNTNEEISETINSFMRVHNELYNLELKLTYEGLI